jgi:RNA polymerase sigma factor (TIGR02999 family)
MSVLSIGWREQHFAPERNAKRPRASAGEESQLQRVYQELRRLAMARLRKLPAGQTLSVTALVNETYLKLMKSGGDRAPFLCDASQCLAVAAEAMRQVVIDHYRRRLRIKRNGEGVRVCLDLDLIPLGMTPKRVLELNDAIDELNLTHPAKAELVKLKYFVGLTMPECAKVLNISVPTAERHWRYARAWLANRLSES